MLAKLPSRFGQVLRNARPGLEQTLYFDPALGAQHEPISLTSPAFGDQQDLPLRYTADGAGVSPPLAWSGIPARAQSLILVIEDADSPTPLPLVHAIVWNLAATSGVLAEGALCSDSTPGQGLPMGKNSFLAAKYLPPDPPPGHGPHRYAMQLFALDHRPDLGCHPGRQRVVEQMVGHLVGKGLLIARFERL